MAEDDYESLPSNTTISTHMLAGGAAGIMEHAIMYPIDCVKTRMQCMVPDPNANYRNVADALYRIVRYEGVRNTVRGLNAVVLGAGPAHALYFACYEKVKFSLSTKHHGNHLANGVAGCCATFFHDAIMNPADVVKARMQVYGSPYKSCLHCASTVWKQEGPRAFYRSYTTQLSMNLPFQSMHFVVYEYCQDTFNQNREYNPGSHMVSGALAGAVASALTTPLDVCKTLLNTQEKCALRQGESAVSGLVQAFRTIYQFQGIPGYFKGMSARVIHAMPSTAISWTVYEFFKFAISRRTGGADHDGYVTSVQVHAHVAAAVTE